MQNEPILIESNAILPAAFLEEARRLLVELDPSAESQGDVGTILATAGYGIVTLDDGSLLFDGCVGTDGEVDELLVPLASLLVSDDGDPARFLWTNEERHYWLQVVESGTLVTHQGRLAFD